MSRIAPVLALAATALALAAGCGGADPAPTATATMGDAGPVRDDAEPLTSRFAALGSPPAVRWQGGTYGSDRAPGPASLWIRAVVTLDGAQARRLRRLTEAGTARARIVCRKCMIPNSSSKCPSTEGDPKAAETPSTVVPSRACTSAWRSMSRVSSRGSSRR